MNKCVAITLAEQVGRADTQRFFAERAGRANVKKVLAHLAKVPATPPMPGDELPEEVKRHVLAVRERRLGYGSSAPAAKKRVAAARKA